LHYKLLDGIDLLFAEGNPSGVKCVLAEMGICENEFRLPVVPVSHILHEQIKHFITTL
jgi:4-hydroxy-tetrahydrodipicolinate synthase